MTRFSLIVRREVEWQVLMSVCVCKILLNFGAFMSKFSKLPPFYHWFKALTHEPLFADFADSGDVETIAVVDIYGVLISGLDLLDVISCMIPLQVVLFSE
jgi:hypothetical protein